MISAKIDSLRVMPPAPTSRCNRTQPIKRSPTIAVLILLPAILGCWLVLPALFEPHRFLPSSARRLPNHATLLSHFISPQHKPISTLLPLSILLLFLFHQRRFRSLYHHLWQSVSRTYMAFTDQLFEERDPHSLLTLIDTFA